MAAAEAARPSSRSRQYHVQRIRLIRELLAFDQDLQELVRRGLLALPPNYARLAGDHIYITPAGQRAVDEHERRAARILASRRGL